MCGRYNIEFEDSDEIEDIIQKVDRKIQKKVYPEGYQLRHGEVYPTNVAPILLKESGKVEPELSVWGFPNYKNKGVIINARAETAVQKPMFRNCLVSRRCIIPSTGFYEWNQEKRKFFIRRPESNALYMAGIWNYYDEQSRFVILTTAANASMEVIHHRMPVILGKNDIETWLFDDSKANDLMLGAMPELKLMPMDQPFEQMSLF